MPKLIKQQVYFCYCTDCEFHDSEEHSCDARLEELAPEIEGCYRIQNEYEDPYEHDPDAAYDEARAEGWI